MTQKLLNVDPCCIFVQLSVGRTSDTLPSPQFSSSAISLSLSLCNDSLLSPLNPTFFTLHVTIVTHQHQAFCVSFVVLYSRWKLCLSGMR